MLPGMCDPAVLAVNSWAGPSNLMDSKGMCCSGTSSCFLNLRWQRKGGKCAKSTTDLGERCCSFAFRCSSLRLAFPPRGCLQKLWLKGNRVVSRAGEDSRSVSYSTGSFSGPSGGSQQVWLKGQSSQTRGCETG